MSGSGIGGGATYDVLVVGGGANGLVAAVSPFAPAPMTTTSNLFVVTRCLQ